MLILLVAMVLFLLFGLFLELIVRPFYLGDSVVVVFCCITIINILFLVRLRFNCCSSLINCCGIPTNSCTVFVSFIYNAVTDEFLWQ